MLLDLIYQQQFEACLAGGRCTAVPFITLFTCFFPHWRAFPPFLLDDTHHSFQQTINKTAHIARQNTMAPDRQVNPPYPQACS